MDFMTAYERFCQKAKARDRRDGILTSQQYNARRSLSHQVHHITPKILGGKNTPENYVLLDGNSHRYAHVLLNLALMQKGKTDILQKLGYYDCPEIDFLMKQNAIKSCKLAVYVEGKKHEPIVMSLQQAAKYFCFVARRNFMNNAALKSLEMQVFKMAMQDTPRFGYKVKFAFACS